MAFNNTRERDPRFLYYAKRRGWNVYGPWLSVRAIEGLRAHGATTVVTSDMWPAPDATRQYLGSLTLVDVLPVGDRHVYLHRID
jgi:hypothetical protein